jgi:hypothetical protein
MTRIVRTAYRYKRPPGKRKAVALEVPAVVKAADPAKASKRLARGKSDTLSHLEAAAVPPINAAREPAATPDRSRSAIVTIRSRKGAMLAHLLDDMTPEEHRRRGDAADALFRAVVRRATGRTPP